MNANKKRLVPEEIRAAIVADYNAGKRVLDIEEEHGVNRPTLYWVLDQAGVLPGRTNRGERLRGNTEDLRLLYELIQAQEDYVEKLEALLVAAGIPLPDDLT
jgi:transposase-like protein